MRVLYFHQYFSTADGAIGVRSYEMARALVKAGHQVHVICGNAAHGASGLTNPFENGRRHGIVDDIEVTEFRVDYSNSDRLTRRAWKFLRLAVFGVNVALRERCDLVFATSTPLTAALPGIAARWLRGRPFVFEVRDLWPELPRAMGVVRNPLILGAMSVLEWCAYRSAHACVGLSPGICDGIRRRSPPGKCVEMIPNGCDLQTFSRRSTDRRRAEGVVESDLLAVFTGAHGAANGLDVVLDTAARLKADGVHDIKLALVGEGARKQALIERKARERLDNCLFIDSIPRRELPSLLSGADVALMILANVPAFYYGTSPNKFFDYLSMGLPVLVNHPGWLADMLTEHDAGVVVTPDSPERFAATLVDLARDRDALARMGHNARVLGESRFDRRDLARRFVALLERHASGAGA